MKYRKSSSLRVLYDLSGRRQEEITQYQGFLEIAEREGWQVLAVSEQIESQIRRLCERGAIDAVVANFISETWLSSLPASVWKIHMGMSPLGKETSCVVWDLEKTGRRLRAYLEKQGYEHCWMFAPQDQPRFGKGLQAAGQFRTTESMVAAGSELRNGAIVCPTDYAARVALRALQQSGFSVPGEVGLAGVGGRSLDAVLSEATITSVRLPYAEKGRQAGELLLHLAGGHSGDRIFLSPGRILPGESTEKHGAAARLVQQVEAWLVPEIQSPPPVEEWARRAGMSRRAYERAFSEQSGCTPYEYLLRLREEEAKRLLRESGLTITRIGEEIGIPDPQRFSAFFKKRVGVAPGEWRREAG